jgi:Cu+-exporting ATPase
MDMEKYININGITCAGCLNRIGQGLNDLGVIKFDYDFADHQGMVLFDTDDTSMEEIIKKINDMGYEATLV